MKRQQAEKSSLVVKERVIEKNLQSFQPISFHCSRKVNFFFLQHNLAPFIKDINTLVFDCAAMNQLKWNNTIPFLLVAELLRFGVLAKVCCSVSWRQTPARPPPPLPPFI